MVFGITGGSGSGKSVVSKMLGDMGVEIIDTDKIAHEVTSAGSECLIELRAAFGDGIILDDGSLNRKKLASIAFSDESKTALLNKITHKYIKAEVLRRIEQSEKKLIGIDGAVIIGSNIEPVCEKIVVVTAQRSVRISRIKERDGLIADEAKKRLKAQPADDFYISHSDYHIENNSTVEELKKQVTRLYSMLIAA